MESRPAVALRITSLARLSYAPGRTAPIRSHFRHVLAVVIQILVLASAPLLTYAASPEVLSGQPASASHVAVTIAPIRVSSFTLIDADTDQPVASFDPVTDGAMIDLSSMPSRRLTIRANVGPGTVGSIRFGLDGNSNYHIESSLPYALAGDNQGDYSPWMVKPGNHTLSATPYTASQARGTAGVPLTVTFMVMDHVHNAPLPTPLSQPTPQLVTSQPALLSSYVIKPSPHYRQAKYRPRSFSSTPYLGWDRLDLPGKATNDGVNTTLSNADWLTLQLTRPAQIAIVWRGRLAPPQWLQKWSKANAVSVDGKTYPTFRGTAPAGRLVLGAVNNPGITTSQATYLVLLAEGDGNPSRTPEVPAGQETPQPNTTCPAWAHNRYMAQGPDGKLYPTWHPKIDPVYWCYFHHEHGTDPALFPIPGYQPLYGYTASRHGMDEPHAGFKSYVLDDRMGHQWMVTQHFGTGSIKRACNRFHTLDLVVADASTQELLADLHLMGDYGKSVANRTSEPLRPAACPNQAADASNSTGERRIPVETRGAIGYEPWRVDTRGNILGLNTASLTMNAPSGMVRCDDIACNTAIPTGRDGSFRFVTYVAGFGLRSGPNTGVFFTDPMGKILMQKDGMMAVQQYVKAGVSFTSKEASCHYYPADVWRVQYVCSSVSPIDRDMNLEGQLQIPN